MITPEEEVAGQSLGSSAVLTFSNIISNGLLGFSSLLVARLLGPQNYGIYTLALSLPFFIQLLIGIGVTSAITRYSSYHLAKGDALRARQMTKNGIIFILLSGTAFTIIAILLSPFFATFLLHRSEIMTYVEIAALFIISQTIFSSVNLGFIGWGSSTQVALWTILQAVLKLLLSVGLVLLGYGITGALSGYLASLLIAGTLGLLSLYILKFRSKGIRIRRPTETVLPSRAFQRFTNDIREMMSYGAPSFFGSIILNFSQQPVLVIILSAVASNTVIGEYSAASVIALGVAMVAGSFTTALFPTFSRLEGMNSDTRSAFGYAVKYVSFVMIPSLFFLIGNSGPVMELFYGNGFSQSSFYLSLLAISILPLAFGQAVLPAYFMGVGKTRLMMRMNLAETLATLIPAFLFIYAFKLGIDGLLYAIIISNIAPTALGLYSAKKYLGAKVDYGGLSKTALVSAFSVLITYGMTIFWFVGISPAITFVTDMLIFLAAYLTFAPLCGAVRREDVTRLRTASNSFRALKKLLDPVLDYENWMINHLEEPSSKSQQINRVLEK